MSPEPQHCFAKGPPCTLWQASLHTLLHEGSCSCCPGNLHSETLAVILWGLGTREEGTRDSGPTFLGVLRQYSGRRKLVRGRPEGPGNAGIWGCLPRWPHKPHFLTFGLLRGQHSDRDIGACSLAGLNRLRQLEQVAAFFESAPPGLDHSSKHRNGHQAGAASSAPGLLQALPKSHSPAPPVLGRTDYLQYIKWILSFYPPPIPPGATVGPMAPQRSLGS